MQGSGEVGAHPFTVASGAVEGSRAQPAQPRRRCMLFIASISAV